jgi:hypothetical protein
MPPTQGGAIAQLGERLNGIQEVVGSIPIGSTNFRHKSVIFWQFSPPRRSTPLKNHLAARLRLGRPGPAGEHIPCCGLARYGVFLLPADRLDPQAARG